ncbi:MAG: phosphatase PAP2 family protein [Bacteroidaceae bacterium]|nr:phosphatase PAP2 family protein [Bacteroidaceae bacterium]
MFDLEQIIDFDKHLLLAMNGSDSLFWDGVMSVYTTTVVWIPFALALIYLLIRNNSLMNFVVLLFMLTLVMVITDGITSTICKPLFARFRPTHDPEIMYLVDVVNNYRAYKYGFMSSHAANSFGIAVFVMLLVKNKLLSFSVIIWALINCYSRIYLGVHYPGDILCGIVVGILSGLFVYRIYSYIRDKMRSGNRGWISDNYTKSGYSVSDIHFMLMVLYATFALIPSIAFLTLHYKFI